jgi:tRNA A37 threonylcarbamoyladenosine dehydratase
MKENVVTMDFLNRTKLLLGNDYFDKIKDKKVAIFGLGGVGGYIAEALSRSGICNFVICDNDIVSTSNINRQIIATTKSVGTKKTTAVKERLLDINPYAKIEIIDDFILYDNVDKYINKDLDFVCDAVDTVTAKVAIILKCNEKNIPVISSMGAGNKLDPTKVKITDIYKTTNDPLSRVMRRELKKRGIKKLTCVYSDELPLTPQISETELKNGKPAPGSIAFVPASFGLAIASHILYELVGKD